MILTHATIRELPASVNAIWRVSKNHGVYKTSEAKDFQGRLADELAMHYVGDLPFEDKVSVRIHLAKADRREFDVDNRLKLILDALQDSGVIKNDNQIYSLKVTKAIGKRATLTSIVVEGDPKPELPEPEWWN